MRTITGYDVHTLDDYLRHSYFLTEMAEAFTLDMLDMGLGTMWATKRHVIVREDRGIISTVRVPNGFQAAHEHQVRTARALLRFADDLADDEIQYLGDFI